MPKAKTHKGASKRFRVTGSGKVKRGRRNKNHILNKKTAKRKMRLRQHTYVDKSQEKTIYTLIKVCK
ncbi:MAG: 50S ribosomal protein L35 [Firmicutes bacterium]|nr:50S ribosomal protein L35 [Bacillota bacterium]